MTAGDRQEPQQSGRLAGKLLRGSALVLVLMALLFNRYSLGLVDPNPPLDPITARGVWATQKTFVLLGLMAWLLAEVVHPTALQERLRRSFGRPRALKLLLLAILLALPLTILELALRPFTTDRLGPKSTTIFIKDPDLGWKLRPGASGHWGEVEVEINEHGLRGPALARERAPDTLRILYLGDSVTFGYNLPSYREAFPHRVEDLLEERAGLAVETINAGVGGYSPWQYEAYLRTAGLAFEPDVVVVGFVLNDVTEKFELARYGGAGEGWQLSQSYYSLDDYLAHNMAIWAALKRVGKRLRHGSSPGVAALKRELVSVEELAHKPNAPRVRKAWNATLLNLDLLATLCAENDLPLVLVAFPFTFQFQDPTRLDAPQRVLAKFCSGRGIPYLDLLPALTSHIREHERRPRDLFIDVDHPSERGSAIIAKLIADLLASEKLLGDLFDQ